LDQSTQTRWHADSIDPMEAESDLFGIGAILELKRGSVVRLHHSLLLLCGDRRILNMQFAAQHRDDTRMWQIIHRPISHSRRVWTMDRVCAWYNMH
jgi:hypothetical protein